ncbi:MAG: SDR family oxidoreductase [Bacteroidetes bacterium]|nr:SDR family oxidoreductase [Bacteroidota bacterium]
MKKILVTGSNGLLGQKLTELYLKETNCKLIATGRGNNRNLSKSGYLYEMLDITDKDEVLNTINKYKPDCIIHTAAMTNVDECELKKNECTLQNVEAVENIVEAANAVNAHLIHISTDFIFDGKNGPYTETAQPNPLSFYGETKLLAEKTVSSKAKKWAIARTVLVYGLVADMSRSNIVLWAKDALENNKKIKVVDDQYRTPTLAEDLAIGCRLIEKNNAEGIFNISGKDFMNIFQLVKRVGDFFKLSLDNVEIVSSKTLNQPAKRPPITGFVIEKAIKELGYKPHSFEQGIEIINKQFEKYSKK